MPLASAPVAVPPELFWDLRSPGRDAFASPPRLPVLALRESAVCGASVSVLPDALREPFWPDLSEA
jgi:hypothetical protein